MTGENLLRLLELRLDNVVHRLGFAASRRERRQMVAHGHFQVNGRKVVRALVPAEGRRRRRSCGRPPSCRPARGRQRSTPAAARSRSGWSWTSNGKKGVVRGLPLREDIQIPVSEQLIVELYSK